MCDELPDEADRAAEANYLRGPGLPFVYEVYDPLTKERVRIWGHFQGHYLTSTSGQSGTFLSNFIVDTFSVHLSYVKQGFQPSSPPIAALALITAAVCFPMSHIGVGYLT